MARAIIDKQLLEYDLQRLLALKRYATQHILPIQYNLLENPFDSMLYQPYRLLLNLRQIAVANIIQLAPDSLYNNIYVAIPVVQLVDRTAERWLENLLTKLAITFMGGSFYGMQQAIRRAAQNSPSNGVTPSPRVKRRQSANSLGLLMLRRHRYTEYLMLHLVFSDYQQPDYKIISSFTVDLTRAAG